MAGPLSSEEIEDVVSSVRRLVSNEQRVKTRDLTAERLVLTSAYRVVPEASPLSPLSPLVLDGPLAEAEPEPVAKAQEVVVEVAVPTAVDPVTALEESLAQALAVDAAPALSAENDSQSARPETPSVDTVEAEWEDEIWAEPGQVSLGEAALAAEEAEVLMAPEPEDMIVAAAEDVGAPLAEDTGGWVDEPIPFVPLRRRAEDLAARLAAGGVVDPTAPADTEEGPGLDVAEAPPAEPAPAEATAIPAAAQPEMATDFYDADGTHLAVLDEAALNEIVRQVLRSELQGELGERITRNVRKLVRAEINRALMARDLD